MNYDNPLIVKKSKEIFKNLIEDKSDDTISFHRFDRWLNSKYELKHKNILSKAYWIERGYSEDFYNNYIIEENKKRGIKLSETNKLKRVNRSKVKLQIGKKSKFKYKGNYYEVDYLPKCNICKSDLSFMKRGNSIEGDYYDIEKCSNISCVTHTSGTKMKQEAFLPNEVYKNIRENMSDVAKEVSRFCVTSYLNNVYDLEEATGMISEIQSNYSNQVKNRFVRSKENLRKLGYSEEDIKRICKTPAMFEFWLDKGFTKEEAKEKISENNRYASSFVDYEKRLLPSNVEYWTNRGFSEKEAKLKVTERQTTFSKDICIEKYGYEDGIKRFNERTNKWLKSLHDGGNLKGGYSKISQILFDDISSTIDGKFKYATKGGELSIHGNDNNFYRYDFTCTDNKKIIEYNGEQYHANPKIYKYDDTPHPFHKTNNITTKEIWEKMN